MWLDTIPGGSPRGKRALSPQPAGQIPAAPLFLYPQIGHLDRPFFLPWIDPGRKDSPCLNLVIPDRVPTFGRCLPLGNKNSRHLPRIGKDGKTTFGFCRPCRQIDWELIQPEPKGHVTPGPLLKQGVPTLEGLGILHTQGNFGVPPRKGTLE